MTGTARLRLLGIIVITITSIALVSRKDQPVLAPQETTGSYLLLRHRRYSDPRTQAPLLSIPGQPNEAVGPAAPTLRIPVIEAPPPRPHSDRPRSSTSSLPAFELPSQDNVGS